MKQEKKKKKIIDGKDNLQGYVMKPHFKKHQNIIELKEIIIYNDDLKKNVCQKRFNLLFRRMTKIVLDVIKSDDTTSGDALIALNEIDRMKKKVIDEFKHNLSKEEIRNMYRKFTLLQKQLQEHIVKLNYLHNFLETNNEKTKGR